MDSRPILTCACQAVVIVLPNEPGEIACCHCGICRGLHEKEFVGFAKYMSSTLVVPYHLLSGFRATPAAERFRCSACGTWLLMVYNGSPQVWVVVDVCDRDFSHVDSYSIWS
jgi:hypothetical protein